MHAKTAGVLGAAEVAGRRGRGPLILEQPVAMPPQTQRRHPGLQRGGGAAHPVRAAVSGAGCARDSATRSCSSTMAARIVPSALLAPAIPAAAARDAGGAVSRQFRPAFGGHGGPRLCARRVCRHAGCGSAESAGGDRQAGRASSMQGYDYVGTIRQQRQDSLWRALVLEGHQQDARVDHAGAHHRSGLHDARLRALGGHRAQSDPRGQHLHSGAGIAVCHEARGSAHRA